MVLKIIEQLPETQLFLVQRQGPMSFVLCDDGAECNHKVLLGPQPTCSCRKGKGKELCIHHIFVMLRVLRLSSTNPLVWQLSFTERELDEALWRAGSRQLIVTREPKNSTEKCSIVINVKRRALEQEDACSICYGDMHERGARAAPELVWCQQGCGHNVHARCLSVWAKHQAGLKQELTCPMCRCQWGPFSWRPPPHQRPSQKQATHIGSHCRGCEQAPVAGKLYTCTTCARLQLCSRCFTGGKHPQHAFSCCAAPGSHDEPVQRDIQVALLTGLTCSGAAPPAAGPKHGQTRHEPSLPRDRREDRQSEHTPLQSVMGAPELSITSHSPLSATNPQLGCPGSNLGRFGGCHTARKPAPGRSPFAKAAAVQPQGEGNRGKGQPALNRQTGKPLPAGRFVSAAVSVQSQECCLQDIVGTGLGCDQGTNRQAASRLEGRPSKSSRQTRGSMGMPRLNGSHAVASCKSPASEKHLQSIANSMQFISVQGVSTHATCKEQDKL